MGRQTSTTTCDGLSNVTHRCNKSKRTRTVFTSFQLFQLESIFKSHKYLSRKQRIVVALKLTLCEKQVKIWFQNRRMKCKKEQQTFDTKPTKNKAQLMTEQSAHKGTVQRLMAYSRSPAIKPIEKLSYDTCIETNTISNTPAASDLNEILDLLEEISPTRSQNSSSSSSNFTNCSPYNAGIQTIKQDLESVAQDWLTNPICQGNFSNSNVQPPINATLHTVQQQPKPVSEWLPDVPCATPMPSVNLIWGQPNSERQIHM